MDAEQSPDTADHANSTHEEQLTAACAEHLRDILSPVALYASVAQLHGNKLPPAAYTKYLRDVVEDCGSPRDPIERMIVEQLVLADANIGRLHMKSGLSTQAEESVAYAAAAGRLTGEFRRLSLALSEYRGRATESIKLAESDDEIRPHAKTA